MIAIDLSKQQVFDADLRAIQQINFTANLDRARNATMLFIIEETKETVFRLLARNCKSFVNVIEWFNFCPYKMTQYNSLNIKLSNSQLNKLKPAIKNETEVFLRISSNMIGDSDDGTNFPHKLLLTDK